MDEQRLALDLLGIIGKQVPSVTQEGNRIVVKYANGRTEIYDLPKPSETIRRGSFRKR